MTLFRFQTYGPCKILWKLDSVQKEEDLPLLVGESGAADFPLISLGLIVAVWQKLCQQWLRWLRLIAIEILTIGSSGSNRVAPCLRWRNKQNVQNSLRKTLSDLVTCSGVMV